MMLRCIENYNGVEIDTESWFLHSKWMNTEQTFWRVYLFFYGYKLYSSCVTEFIVHSTFETERKRERDPFFVAGSWPD